jgi:hypothetical protein
MFFLFSHYYTQRLTKQGIIYINSVCRVNVDQVVLNKSYYICINVVYTDDYTEKIYSVISFFWLW